MFLRISFVNGTFLDGSRTDGALRLLLLAHTDGGKQGAHADAGGPEVVDLIDLQCRIDLIGSGQDICNLVRGYRVQSAAERVELDEIQVLCCLHIVCGSVQTGVIHPLVHNV